MHICFAAGYVPCRVLDNAFFQQVAGLEPEWIKERTGMETRHIAAEDENTNSMGIKAVEALLLQLPFDVGEIDLIVGASYTPYDTIFSLAHAVQRHLGIPDIQVLNVSTACSSLLNALEVAEGYMALGKSKKALVVSAEHNTAYAHFQDKASGHLWGDGAVALALSSEALTPQDHKVLSIKTGGAATAGKASQGVLLRPWDGGLFMPNGRDVFLHAIAYMSSISKEILEDNGLTVGDLSAFIPHQANMRISRKVAEELDLPLEKLVSNVDRLGNTGNAGCGIAYAHIWESLPKDGLVLMSVFGGGYSYGAMLCKVGA